MKMYSNVKHNVQSTNKIDWTQDTGYIVTVCAGPQSFSSQ